MKTHIKTLVVLSALALAVSVKAQPNNASIYIQAVGSDINFPHLDYTSSDTLAFWTVGTSPSGATIANGQAQGVAVGNSFGEIFYWAGNTPDEIEEGPILSAIMFVAAGSGGGDTYQPFLFDLGTTIYNSLGSPTWNPSTKVNLLSPNDLITIPGIGSKSFVDIELTGSDMITLTSGHSYAFGLYANGASANMTFMRASGTQSDPNGVPYTVAGGPLYNGNVLIGGGWGGGPRNLFIGVYTIPEPATMALLGGAALMALGMIRRRKTS